MHRGVLQPLCADWQMNRVTISDFIDVFHVFPSMAEALKIVAISRFKNRAR